MSKPAGRFANALKHGAYSREVILPGESMKEYEDLLSELQEEWQPSGPTESVLVDRLASLIWRDRRLQVYQQAEMQQRVRKLEISNQASSAREALKQLRSQFAAATTVKEVENILVANEFGVEWMKSKVPQPAPGEEAKWGPAIAVYLEKMDVGKRLEGADEFAAVIDPVADELELIRSKRIDEEIDRTIKRLVQVKTHKQLFLPRGGAPASKVIDVSPRKDMAVTQAKSENANMGQIPEQVV